MLANIIAIVVIAAILGGAIWYIRKSKKTGYKCIGCPNGGNCPHAQDGGCSGCGNAE